MLSGTLDLFIGKTSKFPSQQKCPVLNVWNPLQILTARLMVLSSRPIRFGRTMLLVPQKSTLFPITLFKGYSAFFIEASHSPLK